MFVSKKSSKPLALFDNSGSSKKCLKIGLAYTLFSIYMKSLRIE